MERTERVEKVLKNHKAELTVLRRERDGVKNRQVDAPIPMVIPFDPQTEEIVIWPRPRHRDKVKGGQVARANRTRFVKMVVGFANIHPLNQGGRGLRGMRGGWGAGGQNCFRYLHTIGFVGGVGSVFVDDGDVVVARLGRDEADIRGAGLVGVVVIGQILPLHPI